MPPNQTNQPRFVLGRHAAAELAQREARDPLPPQEADQIRQRREQFYSRLFPGVDLTAVRDTAQQIRQLRAAYADAAEAGEQPLPANHLLYDCLNNLQQAAELLDHAANNLEQCLPDLPNQGERAAAWYQSQPRRAEQ